MTTDNRTNEPTPEQVEAAAKAIRGVDARAALIADVDLAEYRARAALVAAQGAAPVPSSGVDEDDCWHEANCRCVRAGIVDEDALAEVIATATYDWSQQRLEFWRKPKNVEPPGDLDTFIARAVAEWLEGQGR